MPAYGFYRSSAHNKNCVHACAPRVVVVSIMFGCVCVRMCVNISTTNVSVAYLRSNLELG